MPQKRTKKGLAVLKNQGRINFHRQQKPQTTISPLVQILSQYQLMIMVTDQLSSADIVHLTSTCKEINAYLTDDENIFARIKESAHCDGKGIEARARCFGHWQGDVTKAIVQCEATEPMPCEDCKAMVCNSCRYHIAYLDDLPCCKDDPDHWESHEADLTTTLEAMRHCHADHCDECPNFHSGNFPIEAIRAVLLAGASRERRYCSVCKPGFCYDGEPDFRILCDKVLDRDLHGDWCCCTLIDQFIEDSWLCIPCFIRKEAQAYSRRLKREVYKWVKKDDESTRNLIKTEYLCDCGQVADVPYLVDCRWCREQVKTSEVTDLLEDMEVF
ncbi:hypothetical protein E4T42_03802 [Aureobasidium subglaciale]|uniref:Uncharacterized protein n=1 Tax=Aureobasidium subglaciale (strain EXF-2481) TaxID=1043005 RepID=A0A074YJR3_AURSE|nr:uncharacterized protein AUEXF2481DRAFT_268606 [Aureobasidium subglaciale EXF-2481]KAI5209810.1 hypothetical protein E4T38_02229 [Aureobasidium subglaciale]KAI5228479.1 hypothetical protein E4T40_02008 [Aureobasidium subglaciale]KAI5231877.1 hypothetical protein E4T41_02228 [Aureobasidium subglaciale]KAI5251991.1 hypothetical protein E4T42_03802 [Aureobasidium subglaciale]KAI5265863.1 hypothetical protein E4T46_02006 [Aureobasidium subglaciale]